MINKTVREKVIKEFDKYSALKKLSQPKSYEFIEGEFLCWLLAQGWINQEKLLDDIKDIEHIRDVKHEGTIKVGNMTMEVESVQQAFGSKKNGRYWEDGTFELEIDTTPKINEFFEGLMNDMHEDLKKRIDILEGIKDQYSLADNEAKVIDSYISEIKYSIEQDDKTFDKVRMERF